MADPIATNPVDLIASRRWRSALITTYALGLSFFESFILRQLRFAHCREVTILVDPVGYRGCLLESGLASVGRSYRIVPVACRRGAFHLKLWYLQGDEEDCALIGSGNLTFGGCGHNFEVIDIFLSGLQPAVFGDIADALEAILTAPTVDSPRVQLLEKRAAKARSLAHDGVAGSDVRLLCSLIRPIGQEIVQAAADLGGCQRLTILSPYFESLSGVEPLWRGLGQPEIAVALPGTPKQLSRFPFADAQRLGMSVRPVGAHLLEGRPFHAKLFDLECRSGRLLVTGSANATGPALWTDDNVELSVLRRFGSGGGPSFAWMQVDPPAVMDYPPLCDEGGRCACVHAEANEDGLVGQMIGGRALAGRWHWESIGSRGWSDAGDTAVGPDGRFRIPGFVPPLEAGALQIRLMGEDGAIAEGWINQEALIEAIRRWGPVTNAIIRLVAGDDDDDDVVAVLEWLGRLQSAPQAVGYTAASNTSRSSERDTIVAVEDLRPRDLSDEMSAGDHLPRDTVLDRLLAALVRRLRGAGLQNGGHRLPETGNGDEENEDRLVHAQAASERRIEAVLQRLQETLWRIIDDRAIGSADRRAAAVRLLDCSMFVYSRRATEAEADASRFARDWLRRIATAFKIDGGDELDRAVFTLAGALAGSGLSGALAQRSNLHQLLQRFAGGRLPAEARDCLRDRNFPGTAALGAPPDSDLKPALGAVLATVTRWQCAQEALNALREGRNLPVCFLQHEDGSDRSWLELRQKIEDIACRGAVNRIRTTERSSACSCGIALPAALAQRLQYDCVVICPWCGRLLFLTVP